MKDVHEFKKVYEVKKCSTYIYEKWTYAKAWIFLVTEPNPPPTAMGSGGRLATLPPHSYFSRNRDIDTPTAMGSGCRVQQPTARGVAVGLKTEDFLCSAPHLSTTVYKKITTEIADKL